MFVRYTLPGLLSFAIASQGLVSRMQASISGEKERSARLLAVQSQGNLE